MEALSRPPRLATPALVQTLRFFKDPFALLDDALQECGEIFTLPLLGLGDWVFLCSPELIRQMFKAPTDTLAAGEVNARLLGFLLGTDATFSLDGDAHRARQRLVHPHLNGPRLAKHIPAMRDIANRAVDSWPTREPFAFLDHAHRMSLDVMFRALFGATDADRLQRLTELFMEYAHKGPRSPLVAMPLLQRDLGPWSPWGKILRLRAAIMGAFAEEIDSRLADRDADPADAPDIASALTRTRQSDGSQLGRQSLVEEVINLLFAGHETTGNSLAWAMETIHSHPEVEARLREELDTVLGDEPVTRDHLGRLEVLHAVIQETLRFRPLAPMAGVRLAKKPFEIGGYQIAEGMLVAQCFPAMAKRPELYGCPHQFDPDHFYQRKTKPFEWNPFGGGTRMCIGRGLAEVELKVIVATLMQRATFQLAQKQVRPVRGGFFFSPNRGLRLMVDVRR